ncbi:hypothetical protein BOQ64_18235 [Chryseobacterium sp. CH25]|nr:hypothetical protein BOQ64_18235 [Chryseobacterium sp. CH25]RXM64505.1 hypothetical protein BOQ60_09725 [Chryseobacterium sp. CH1]
MSAIFIFCVFGINKLTLKYIKKLLGYKYTYDKPLKMLRGSLKVAGDFSRAWEASNILVFNKRRTWEGCFAVVLDFRREWGGCTRNVLEFGLLGLRKTVRF